MERERKSNIGSSEKGSGDSESVVEIENCYCQVSRDTCRGNEIEPTETMECIFVR